MIPRSDRTINILIVEDDPVDRKALQRALAEGSLGDVGTREAASLAEAVTLLEEETPDIVLLDLGLPDSSGLDSISTLEPWTDNVPIIVLTGYEDEATAVRAVQKGVQDYLNKDCINSNVLTRVIRYAIERKEHERQLRVTEECYRMVFENSAVAIMVTDEAQQLVSWNQVTEDLLGMDRSDLEGREVKSLHPREEWSRISACDMQHVSGCHHVDTKMVRKNGEIIDVEMSLSVLTDSCGKVTGSMAIARDVTTRKKAETVLREREERLNLAISGADLGTWDWNITTGHVRYNSRWAEMLGYRVDELRPHVEIWHELLHPDDAPRAIAAITAHMVGQTPSYEAEYRLRHRSGRWVWVLDRGRVIERGEDDSPLRLWHSSGYHRAERGRGPSQTGQRGGRTDESGTHGGH